MPRIQLEPAYVLHSRAFRETSLIVEAFTREHGRIAVVARPMGLAADGGVAGHGAEGGADGCVAAAVERVESIQQAGGFVFKHRAGRAG